jgi:hypothetical protein
MGSAISARAAAERQSWDDARVRCSYKHTMCRRKRRRALLVRGGLGTLQKAALESNNGALWTNAE